MALRAEGTLHGQSTDLAQAYKPGKVSREQTSQEREESAKTTRLATGAILGTGIALGAFFKDGITEGFRRIGGISNSLSNIFTVPFSLLFPYLTLNNERTSLSGSKSKDDILNRMVYTAASLGFAPNSWGDPLLMATRSKAHMFATVLNLPHILFSFFSYTGGRFLSCIKALQKHKDPKNYRLEQEFEALYKLGNLGSAQVSVIPMSGQCVLGWETIMDVFKGNFGEAWDRFKHEPVSVGLGVLFNSWAFPFEYLSKYLDTTIRTAEGVESFQNISKNSKNSWIIKGLKSLRDWWHKESADKNSNVGKFLKAGRQISKIEALLIPPIGMASVVTPVFNRFLRGEFFNKEAQEIGGMVGFLDKVFNIGAFFSHTFYTGLYALSVRFPQTITTSAFYISTLLNKIRGKERSDQSGYIEPTNIRNKIFNRDKGLIKTVSDWAEIKQDEIELKLHPDNPTLINDIKINTATKQVWVTDKNKKEAREVKFSNEDYECLLYFARNNKPQISRNTQNNEILTVLGTGRSKHIRNFHRVLAEEVCYTPLREKYYSEAVEDSFIDEWRTGNKVKPKGERPTNQKWAQLMETKYQQRILEESRETLKKYLRNSGLLEPEQIHEFMEGKYSSEYQAIFQEIKNLLNDEIQGCTATPKIDTNAPKKQNKVQAKSFLQLLTSWKDLKEVLCLKTFHITNSILPLWIRGFVNVVDYGKENEPFWLRNLKATETGIREGDVKQACDREFMPVVGFAFQSMGKGLALMHNFVRFLIGQGPFPNLVGSHE